MNTNYEFHPAHDRGENNIGWLNSKFSFSFGNYYNPEMMGFGTLRVINDDIIAGGKGFGKHSHNDMEIISVPISGSLSHNDSMGNNTIIKDGEIQAMSAGSGVIHSEMNHNPYEDAKFLQIWIQTAKRGIPPGYSQKSFNPEERNNMIQLLVSPEDSDDTVKINQDAYMSRSSISEGNTVNYMKHKEQNGIYFFLISGDLQIGDYNMVSRDGLGVTNISDVSMQAQSQSDILILEVPMD